MSQNDLEVLLERAATDPGYRPEFYERLLDAEIFVIGHTDPTAAGSATLEVGANLSIQHWQKPDGTPVIPFFTTLETLSASIDQEESYVCLEARALLEVTEGAHLVLNPRSEFGKEFTPDEVQALLSGELLQAGEKHVVQEETTVMIGQPAEFPSGLVSALTTLFARTKEVKAAYLAQMLGSEDGAAPQLVIGVEVDGDFENVARRACMVARDAHDASVNFMEIDDSDLSHYMTEETEPIYRLGWGNALKSLLD